MENNRSRESSVERIETSSSASSSASSSIGTNSTCTSIARQGRRQQQQRKQGIYCYSCYYCHIILLALVLLFSNYNCCYYSDALLLNNMSVQRIVLTTITTRTTGLLSGRHCFRPSSAGSPILNAFVIPSSFRKSRHQQRQQVQQRFLSSSAANNSADITIERKSNVSGGAVSMNEINLSLADGTILKGQHFFYKQQHQTGDDDKKKGKAAKSKIKILALHGWLDNCRSFHYLGPHLIEKFGGDAEFVAIDLPGHGWSSHRPIDGPSTVLSEGVYYVAEALHALGWDDTDDNNDGDEDSSNNVTLIGHSMGGGIATTYAGVFPNQISNLISIDMIGSEPGKPENTASTIRNHVTQRRLTGPAGRKHTLYPTLDRCIEARRKSAQRNKGGHQYISLEAATELITRATIAVYGTDENENTSAKKDDVIVTTTDPTSIIGYKFRHDARLLWPSLQYLSSDQIDYIMKEVEAPVCILSAEDGYPFEKDRIDRAIQNLKPKICKTLPGSHHLHADPDTADAVVDTIYDFLKKS
jgi:pimeloyl-ACP methyl ester carboxylesterase